MKSLESKGYPFVHAIHLVALLKHKDLFNQIFASLVVNMFCITTPILRGTTLFLHRGQFYHKT